MSKQVEAAPDERPSFHDLRRALGAALVWRDGDDAHNARRAFIYADYGRVVGDTREAGTREVIAAILDELDALGL